MTRHAFPTRLLLAALAGAALVGCRAQELDPNLVAATDVGRYGGARVALENKLPQDPSDRSYILERLRLLILTLADGQPGAAEEIANQTFRLLRTQGINADRTAASVVLNEDVKIWKGEPFEQALGYTYIAMQNRLEDEMLVPFISPVGGGYFYVLPGVTDAQDYYARGLLT